MQVRLTVTGRDATAAMRSLEAWLAGHDELRGRVRPVVMAPQPGTMGSVAEVLSERNPPRRRGDHSHR